MSIVSEYEVYRDRVYGLLNEWLPIQHSLDVLTGEVPNPIEELIPGLVVPGVGEIDDPDGSYDDETDDEEVDDEFGDG